MLMHPGGVFPHADAAKWSLSCFHTSGGLDQRACRHDMGSQDHESVSSMISLQLLLSQR
jgi:hypothetical protein